MAHRLAVLGAVGGMVLTATPAVAGELPAISADCVVQQVDERGGVTDTSTVREGTVAGRFRCVDGRWQFVQNPFERGDAITSPEIQIDPAGNVSPTGLEGPALGMAMTLGDMARVVQAITGEQAVIDRAIVAVDDGRQRTPDEVQALLAGKDTTGVKVLRVVDRLDPAMSTKDIIDETEGAEPETTVVYFSIGGFFRRLWAWIVSAATWVKEHCKLVPSPTGGGAEIECKVQW